MPLALDLPQAISGGCVVANRRVAGLLEAMRYLAAVLAIPKPLPKAAFAVGGLVLRGGQGECGVVLELVEDVGEFGVLRGAVGVNDVPERLGLGAAASLDRIR